MSVILLASILIRLLALAWSIALWRRVRDWSMAFLAIMLGLMALRQILALNATRTSWSSLDFTAQVTEIPGLVVSIMAFLAVVFLKRMLDSRSRSVDTLRMQADLQAVLFKELDHRVRNNLSSIISLIDLSRQNQKSVPDFATIVRERTETLAAVHDILSQSKWNGGKLAALIQSIVGGNDSRGLHVEGPDVLIPLAQTQAFGMILSELTTNSSKYGSMSVAGGTTSITWLLLESDDGKSGLDLTWCERGGPRIEAEPVLGTGLNLVAGIARSELRGGVELTFPPEGATHTLRAVIASDATAQFSPTASARTATAS